MPRVKTNTKSKSAPKSLTRQILLVFLIMLQLNFIIFLVVHILSQKSKSINDTDYFVIEKAKMNFPQVSKLKNFYEPKPNSKETINQNKAPQDSVATINNDSLNERFDYPVNKPKNSFRIITLGDSYTYGLYVDTKDNWTEILEDKLNYHSSCSGKKQYEVINLAVHGYDFQYSVKRYKLRGVKYKPDLVIWFIKDSLRITEKISQYAKAIEAYLKATQDTDKLNSYYSWRKAWNQVLSDYGEDRILNFQKKQLKNFNNLYPSKLVFIMGAWIPVQHQDCFASYLKLRDNTWVTRVDLLPKQRFTTDSHPNPLGHQVIAQDIYDYLIKNKLVPCN
jgi:lysophospholipase L1-like esterase